MLSWDFKSLTLKGPTSTRATIGALQDETTNLGRIGGIGQIEIACLVSAVAQVEKKEKKGSKKEKKGGVCKKVINICCDKDKQKLLDKQTLKAKKSNV